jgi:hypothetical protein
LLGSTDLPPLGVFGVGHEVKPVPDVRSAEARSAGIDRPDGVIRCFQVSANKVEPSKSVRACNLLAKDNVRSALANEPRPVRPEMALITESSRAPRCTEGLAGAGAGPDSPLVGPSCEPEGVGPDPDPGEEVALDEASQVVSLNIDN